MYRWGDWLPARVLYVGNSTANGDFNSADLEKVTQDVEYKFPARVSASAPVSPVHLVVGLIGGEVHRFNVLTKQAELLVDLDAPSLIAVEGARIVLRAEEAFEESEASFHALIERTPGLVP